MRALAAVLIGLLVAGCATRDRSNPFDPANQVTSGRPSGFAAVAGNGRVDLRWDATTANGLQGYRIFRRVGGVGDFVPLTGVLHPANTSYADLGLQNGVDHEYRLFFVFSRGLGDRPAEDVATPGLVQPWVVDYFEGVLAAVAPDGREVARRLGGFRGPASVAVDSVRRLVWVSEYSGNTVRVYDAASRTLVTSIPGLVVPGAIAAQPADGTAWVCDEQADRVLHFASSGAPAGPAIEVVDDPLGVAANPLDRSVWVCEWAGNRVRHHDEGAALIATSAIDRPSRVAVDAATGRAWATSFSGAGVFRLDPVDGTVQLRLTTGFSGPIGIAVDDVRRRVWVADARASQLVALATVDGEVQFRVNGIAGARDVAVDLDTGEAWVTASDAGELVRVSPTGTILRRLPAFQVPLGVAIDHLPSRGP